MSKQNYQRGKLFPNLDFRNLNHEIAPVEKINIRAKKLVKIQQNQRSSLQAESLNLQDEVANEDSINNSNSKFKRKFNEPKFGSQIIKSKELKKDNKILNITDNSNKNNDSLIVNHELIFNDDSLQNINPANDNDSSKYKFRKLGSKKEDIEKSFTDSADISSNIVKRNSVTFDSKLNQSKNSAMVNESIDNNNELRKSNFKNFKNNKFINFVSKGNQNIEMIKEKDEDEEKIKNTNLEELLVLEDKSKNDWKEFKNTNQIENYLDCENDLKLKKGESQSQSIFSNLQISNIVSESLISQTKSLFVKSLKHFSNDQFTIEFPKIFQEKFVENKKYFDENQLNLSRSKSIGNSNNDLKKIKVEKNKFNFFGVEIEKDIKIPHSTQSSKRLKNYIPRRKIQKILNFSLKSVFPSQMLNFKIEKPSEISLKNTKCPIFTSNELVNSNFNINLISDLGKLKELSYELANSLDIISQESNKRFKNSNLETQNQFMIFENFTKRISSFVLLNVDYNINHFIQSKKKLTDEYSIENNLNEIQISPFFVKEKVVNKTYTPVRTVGKKSLITLSFLTGDLEKEKSRIMNELSNQMNFELISDKFGQYVNNFISKREITKQNSFFVEGDKDKLILTKKSENIFSILSKTLSKFKNQIYCLQDEFTIKNMKIINNQIIFESEMQCIQKKNSTFYFEKIEDINFNYDSKKNFDCLVESIFLNISSTFENKRFIINESKIENQNFDIYSDYENRRSKKNEKSIENTSFDIFSEYENRSLRIINNHIEKMNFDINSTFENTRFVEFENKIEKSNLFIFSAFENRRFNKNENSVVNMSFDINISFESTKSRKTHNLIESNNFFISAYENVKTKISRYSIESNLFNIIAFHKNLKNNENSSIIQSLDFNVISPFSHRKRLQNEEFYLENVENIHLIYSFNSYNFNSLLTAEKLNELSFSVEKKPILLELARNSIEILNIKLVDFKVEPALLFEFISYNPQKLLDIENFRIQFNSCKKSFELFKDSFEYHIMKKRSFPDFLKETFSILIVNNPKRMNYESSISEKVEFLRNKQEVQLLTENHSFVLNSQKEMKKNEELKIELISEFLIKKNKLSTLIKSLESDFNFLNQNNRNKIFKTNLLSLENNNFMYESKNQSNKSDYIEFKKTLLEERKIINDLLEIQDKICFQEKIANLLKSKLNVKKLKKSKSLQNYNYNSNTLDLYQNLFFKDFKLNLNKEGKKIKKSGHLSGTKITLVNFEDPITNNELINYNQLKLIHKKDTSLKKSSSEKSLDGTNLNKEITPQNDNKSKVIELSSRKENVIDNDILNENHSNKAKSFNNHSKEIKIQTELDDNYKLTFNNNERFTSKNLKNEKEESQIIEIDNLFKILNPGTKSQLYSKNPENTSYFNQINQIPNNFNSDFLEDELIRLKSIKDLKESFNKPEIKTSENFKKINPEIKKSLNLIENAKNDNKYVIEENKNVKILNDLSRDMTRIKNIKESGDKILNEINKLNMKDPNKIDVREGLRSIRTKIDKIPILNSFSDQKIDKKEYEGTVVDINFNKEYIKKQGFIDFSPIQNSRDYNNSHIKPSQDENYKKVFNLKLSNTKSILDNTVSNDLSVNQLKKNMRVEVNNFKQQSLENKYEKSFNNNNHIGNSFLDEKSLKRDKYGNYIYPSNLIEIFTNKVKK